MGAVELELLGLSCWAGAVGMEPPNWCRWVRAVAPEPD